MRIGTLRRSGAGEDVTGVTGTARVDRRTKRLTTRLTAGDVAVIDQVDLDRATADAFVAAGVVAVVNAAPSISGRFPNLGPEVLVTAGIPIVDDLGDELFELVTEGQRIRVDGDRLLVDDEPVAAGQAQDRETVAAAMADARHGLAVQLESFAANTSEYLKRERELLLDGVGVPSVGTPIEDRHCLVVSRGFDYREDLARLAAYIREFRPVLIGVDGGADALVEAGYRPDLIVGDLDAVGDQALKSGAEVVIHAYPDGRAPGLERLQDLDIDAIRFPSAATNEDIAMLLADVNGAKLVVAVGMHANLVEFLDRGRAGMASTVLTRLRLGAKLVDAKSAAQLHRPSISGPSLVLLVTVVILAMALAVVAATVGQSYLQLAAEQWDGVISALRGLIS